MNVQFYQKLLVTSIEMIMWFLLLNLLMWCYHTDWFVCVWIWDHPCIFGINTTWWWCMVRLVCCWIWFSNILLRILTSMFRSDCCCSVMSGCLWSHGLQDTRLPILHHLPGLLKLMSIESVMPSDHLVPVVPFSSCLQSFPASYWPGEFIFECQEWY